MLDWLYRLIYRREIRERQERMAGYASVWRARQEANDAAWARSTAELHAWRDALRLASTPEEVEAVIRRAIVNPRLVHDRAAHCFRDRNDRHHRG